MSVSSREVLADALFSESVDLAEVLNELLVLPSTPAIQVLTQTLGRIKNEIYSLLESAAQFDTAASEGERDGDIHRVILCSGQVMGYENAAGRIAEAFVETFDLWQQYETRVLPGRHRYEQAVERSQTVKKSVNRCSDCSSRLGRCP